MGKFSQQVCFGKPLAHLRGKYFGGNLPGKEAVAGLVFSINYIGFFSIHIA